MEVHFTARKFRAHKAVKEHAASAVKRLDKYFDGIDRADIILSFERTSNSLKSAEINLHVRGTMLSAKEKSEEFAKSIDLATEKLERQLAKYKTKTRMKHKKTLRRIKEETVAPAESGDDE